MNWEPIINGVTLYHVDTFCMDSDCENKFDFLKPYCDVVYLPRTEGISTTQRKGQGIQKLSIA